MDCKEGYCWDETDLKIINDHLKYHEQMVQYIKSLKEGEFSEIEPKKPSSKLPPTMRSRNHKLEGIELHDYLKKSLTISEVFDLPRLCVEEPNFEDIKKYLENCVKYEKTGNKYFLKFYMEYGQALEYFYGLWRNEKIKGNIRLPWNEWLNYNLNISARDVRKKREMHKTFGGYKKLHQTTLSFNELYTRRTAIRCMLLTNREISNFWSTN